MAFCVDFSEVDLVEEIEFLPLIYKDFTIADQCIMFDRIQKLEKSNNNTLMDRFRAVYEHTYNELFSMPIFEHPITYYENLRFKDEEIEYDENCYGPPLEARIAGISFERGCKDSYELVSVQPAMILDTVYYSKKGNKPILYDDDDEGAPLLTKSLWKKIQSEMNVDLIENHDMEICDQENPLTNDGLDNQPRDKRFRMLTSDQNAKNEKEDKSPKKFRGGKRIQRKCPYSLRQRQSNHGDSKCCDTVALPESMEIEHADDVGYVKSKFIDEEFISVRKMDAFIYLCNGSEFIKISKTQSQVAYYSDGKIWVEQFCKSKLTALSLLRGYIENRDEVNSVWSNNAVNNKGLDKRRICSD